MGQFQDLKAQAAIIRDEQNSYQNTSLRVGRMFIDILEQLEKVLPDENVKPETLTVEATETSYKLKFSTLTSDGSVKSRELDLPIATDTKAGVMSPALMKGIKDLISQLSLKVDSNKTDSDNKIIELDDKISVLEGKVIGKTRTHRFTTEEYSINLDFSYSAGDTVYIVVETDPSVMLQIAGNSTTEYEEGNKYPYVNVKDGYGVNSFKYNSEGKLGNFGFASSGSVKEEFTAKFTLYIERGDSFPIISKIIQLKTEVDESKADISDLNKSVDYIAGCVIFNETYKISKETYQYNIGYEYEAGDTLSIEIKTDPTISININGNSTTAYEGGNKYPMIKVVNGYGKSTFKFNENGRLTNFGLANAPEEEFSMSFLVIKAAGMLGELENAVSNIEADFSDLDGRTSSLESLVGSKPTNEKQLIVSESVYSVNLESEFKSGQRVIIEVYERNNLSVNIAGNIIITGQSTIYPSIKVVDGYGMYENTFDNDGKLLTFGFPKYPEISYAIDFKIYIIDKDDIIVLKEVEKLNERVQELEQSQILFDSDFIPSISDDDPIKNILRVPGYASIFRSWGFVADSLGSGEMECYDGDTKKYIDMYEYSWGQHMCRLCGSEGYNFSQGGQTAKGWITNQSDRGWKGAQENLKQAYIIALGVNDTSKVTSGEIEVGNVDTDIDMDDYNNNADTFAGNYAGIIQRLRSVQSRCIIFVVSMPNDSVLNPIMTIALNRYHA